MRRCEAKTKSGKRCLNHPLANSDHCHIHKDRISDGSVAAAGLGALIGHAVLPGIGGVLLGGISASIARQIYKDSQMSKRKVFVSFDFDNDRVLKDFIIGQARLADSPFEVIDHSLKEAAPEADWPKKARAAIKRAEIVVVMVGKQTHRAQGVLKEVAMAREEGVPIVQVIGYRDGQYTAVPNAGRLYAWNWNNLKRLLA